MKNLFSRRTAIIGLLTISLGLIFSFTNTFKPNESAKSSIEGAWEIQRVVEGKLVKHQVLISGKAFTFTEYDSKTGAFGFTKGGTWTRDKDKMNITYEFHTQDSTMVGVEEEWVAKFKKNKLKLITSSDKGAYISIDNPTETEMEGAYLFSGRKKDGVGELRSRDTNRPRKTMKVLTGSHFQWIAFDTEKKKFYGTGGGSYTAKDGQYVENIEFFSRDNSRVGASLKFNFKMENGDWHHHGKSSKGAPMYEVWSNRK